MIVLDANVLIAFLDASDRHHDATLGLLAKIDREIFGAAALTISEALVHPRGRQAHLRALAAVKRIGVVTISTDDDPLLLAEIRHTYGLRMPDAVVLAAALLQGATLATFDAKLAGAARAAGLEVVPA